MTKRITELSSLKRFQCAILLCLLSIFALGYAGCGDSNSHYNIEKTPKTSVKFKFQLQKNKADIVPEIAQTFEFNGYSDSEFQNKVYGPKVVSKDAVTQNGQEQIITLTDVPITVKRFHIKMLNTEQKVVAESYSVKDMNLTPNTVVEVDVANDAPIILTSYLAVIFNTEKLALPSTITNYMIEALDENNKLTQEAVKVQINKNLEPYIFEEISLKTKTIQVKWFTANSNTPSLKSTVDCPKMEGDEGYTVEINSYQIIEISPVTVSINNVYKLANDLDENSQVDAVIEYSSSLEVDGHMRISRASYDRAQGTASFEAVFNGSNIKLASVKLYEVKANDNKAYPFEWLDYETPIAAVNGKITLDVAANEFYTGDGTASSPYQVANPRHLNNVRNYLGSNFIQVQDIDFEQSCGISIGSIASGQIGATKDNTNARFYNGLEFGTKADVNGYIRSGWIPIAGSRVKESPDSGSYFYGNYDGGNYSISNLKTCGVLSVTGGDGGCQRIGLFGTVSNDEENGVTLLKNIRLDSSCSFAGSNTTGSVVGYLGHTSYKKAGRAKGSVTIENCQSSAQVVGDYNIGGLCGYICQISATIKDCTVSGLVKHNKTIYKEDGTYEEGSNAYFGGIVGVYANRQTDELKSTLIMKNCEFKGTLTGMEYLALSGGILGYNNSSGKEEKIEYDHCICSGTIDLSNISANNVGGIVGRVGKYPTMLQGTTLTGEIKLNSDTDIYSNIGGIIGQGTSSDATYYPISDLKTMLANCAEPNFNPGTDNLKAGKYCGNKKLDSLTD